jgi:HK97 family phage major capsid protein
MTIAAPERPDQWEHYVMEELDSPEKFVTAFRSGEFKTKLMDYTASKDKGLAELRAEALEQGQKAVVAMFERNGAEFTNRIDLAGIAKRKGAEAKAYYSPDAPGAKLDGKFASVAHAFHQSLAACGVKALSDIRVDPDLMRVMDYGTQDPAAGGFLVPEEVRSDIMTRSLDFTVVRPQAQVVPMPSGRMAWPANDFSTEVGEVYGGMYAQWVAEGEEIPASEAKFAMIRLDANKLAARGVVPNELLRSAPAFQSWLMTNTPKAVGHAEDIGYLKGNGVGKPLGGLHPDNPALITVNKESGQPAASITWINVISMAARMLPENLANAEWDVTQDAMLEIMTMALPVGTGGSSVWAANAREGQPMTLFSRPIRWTRKTPGILGTKGDISLVDWNAYVIGDTQAMALESSSHEQFSSDKTVFRCIQRGDGQPAMLSALTPENGGPTLSAFVQLETRS